MIEDRKEYSTLQKALDAADLSKVLREKGPFLVLAPNNKAFEELGEDYLDALLSNPPLLKTILQAHIIRIKGDLGDVDELLQKQNLTNLNGKRIHIRSDNKGNHYVGWEKEEITLSKNYQDLENGVVFTINRLLGGGKTNAKALKKSKSPERSPSTPETGLESIYDFLESEQIPELSTFKAAIDAADMADNLRSGNYIVFAPNNNAFDALPEGSIEDLLEPKNQKNLRALLYNHIVKNPKNTKLEDKGIYTTLSRNKLYVEEKDGVYTVNLAEIKTHGTVAADVIAPEYLFTNGFVNIIDTVLIPEGHVSPRGKSKAKSKISPPKETKKEKSKSKVVATPKNREMTAAEAEAFLNAITGM